MTHTFLERSELVPVVITFVVREKEKEGDNKTTSVRVFTSNKLYSTGKTHEAVDSDLMS